MTALSICSGIEAASVAWNPLGIRTIGVAEIEPFPCSVLAHHHPTVPNFGDLTKHHEWPELHPDILVGGTPCQAFSVAGLRKGLADPRGNLTLVFLGLVARQRPRWVVWENVPGVLSIDSGRTFGAFLGGLGQLGYGFSYRVLDAQFVRVESHARGVPQRRRRVFVVGHLGDWRRAAAVLFERESLRGDSPPRREAGKGIALSFTERTRSGGRQVETQEEVAYALDNPGNGGRAQTRLVAVGIDGGEVGFALQSQASHSGDKGDGGMNCSLVAHCLKAEGFDASEDGTGRGTPLVPVVVGCLSDGAHNGGGLTGRTPTRAESSLPPVAWALQERDSKGTDSDTKEGHLIPMLQGGFFEEAYVKSTNPHSADEAPTFTKQEVAACLNGWDERHDPPKHMIAGLGLAGAGQQGNGQRHERGASDSDASRRFL